MRFTRNNKCYVNYVHIYMINDFFSFSFFSCYYCEEYVKNERVGGIFRIIIIKYFLHNFFPAFFFFFFYISTCEEKK